MQRSSPRFLGCMWRQPIAAHLLARRPMADYSSGKSPPKGGNTGRTGSSNTSGNRLTSSAQRPILREDNMWTEPHRVETKWLRSRDPQCYKPDFKQTEPHMLRKQFMRSPDERTRDAMSREWETTIRNAATVRRQEFLAKQKQEKVQAKKNAKFAKRKEEEDDD